MKNQYHNSLQRIFSHIDIHKKQNTQYGAKFLLSRWITSTVTSLTVVFLTGFLIVSAAPTLPTTPTGGYLPGTELDPVCAPGSADCIVKAPVNPTTVAWSLTGNSGTTPGANFIGTTDAKDLVFKTNNSEVLRILSTPAAQNIIAKITGGDMEINGLLVGRGTGNDTTNTVTGYNSLVSNTVSGGNNGKYNVAFGYNTLALNTTGFGNTGVGSQSLKSNTTGRGNTAIGSDVLGDNTTGIKNTGIGSAALRLTTTGSFNTAIGNEAFFGNTTGSNNVAIGFQAHDIASSGTIASNDVAIGVQALYNNVSGNNNTALGFQAGLGIISGGNNTLLGKGAGIGITTGANNTIIGANMASLSSTNSLSNNILIADGSGNLRWRTDNTGKSIVGSGITAATTIGNTFQINHGTAGNSGLRLTNLTSAPLLATNSTGDVVSTSLSNVLPASSINGQVLTTDGSGGFSFSTPTNPTTVAWSLTGNSGTTPGTNFIGTTDDVDLVFKVNNMIAGTLYTETSNSSANRRRVDLGRGAGGGVTTATESTFIGGSAGFNATNAAGSTFIGSLSGADATDASNSNFFGFQAGQGATNASNSIFIGHNSGTLDTVNNTITAGDYSILMGSNTKTGGFSNSIAIGSFAKNTAANQFVIGSNSANNSNTSNFRAVNEVKVFGNIAGTDVSCTITTGTGLACSSDERLKTNITNLPDDTLSKLIQVKTARYNWIGDESNPHKQVGFIAQDLEKFFPEMVGTDTTGTKYVYYSQMAPILTQAIRELNTKVDMAVLSTGNTSATGFFDALKNWLGNTTNGLEKLFARRVETTELCITDTNGTDCYNRNQLKQLVGNGTSLGSGNTSSVTTSDGTGVDLGTDSTVDGSAGTVSTDTTESTTTTPDTSAPADSSIPRVDITSGTGETTQSVSTDTGTI